MSAEELGGEMSDAVTGIQMKQVLRAVEGMRTDFKPVSDLVLRHYERIRETRKDVDTLKEVVGTDGRNGLVMEMRDFRAEMKAKIDTLSGSIDLALTNDVVQQRENKGVVDWEKLGIDWAKIGKVVFGFLAAAGYWFGIN